MNGAEFNKWWKDYQTTFPSIAKWLEKTEAPAETLAKWTLVLAPHTLANCLEATRLMLIGTEDRPDWPDEIPRAIARIAKRVRFAGSTANTPKTTERTYRCRECWDTGMLSVWHPAAMRQAYRGEVPTQLAPCKVQCRCGRGKAIHEQPPAPKPGGGTYSRLPFENDFCIRWDCLATVQDNVAALSERLEAWSTTVLDEFFAVVCDGDDRFNRVSEFDQFNRGEQ